MVWRLRAPARGGFYSFGQMALRSARAKGRAGFFFKLVLAPVARGMFSLLVKWLALRAGQRQGGVFRIPPPYLWTPLSPQRVKGCSPLTIPKKKSKPKNASRFAKTGCGSQRLLRCRSHPAGRCPNSSSLFPPQAAVVAVAHFFVLLPFTAPPKILPFC